MAPSTPSSFPLSSSPIDPDLLDRYLAGTASADDHLIMTRWLDDRPQRKVVLDVIQRAEVAGLAPHGGPASKAPLDIDADWAALSRRLEGVVPAPTVTPSSRTHRQAGVSSRTWQPWKSVAAAVFVGAAALGIVFVTSADKLPWQQEQVAGMVYTTARAQHETLTLADGTIVRLGPASTLRASEDGRDVQLVGEALFTVVHAADRPFTVTAGPATTTVLGTEFSVRAYPGEPVTRVAVLDGRVQVDRATVLEAGDVARVGTDGVASVLRQQNVTPYRDWANGTLAFDNVPLSAVVNDLARWYDIEIRVNSSSLLRDHITATFGSNSLDYVIQALQMALGATVERDGRVITISRPAASRSQ